MQTRNRILDDMARLATGAAGVAAGMRGEVEAAFRLRLERLLADMDLVTREEFEATRDALAKARTEQEHLRDRLHDLEARIANSDPTDTN